MRLAVMCIISIINIETFKSFRTGSSADCSVLGSRVPVRHATKAACNKASVVCCRTSRQAVVQHEMMLFV